ncbi:protein kinase domain-containing protein [Colletotrichum plurivorum]|uniref:non-specific serine/threonine protein kinase n=1 Tax=Colletotrichum plurivorum TaxID=2175906 RepID=A0A8H6KTG9_9PEZI|nr:protein kinase domain-containing protein [Colletotrichum plurivorum]
MATNSTSPHGPNGEVYIPEVDVEDFENYRIGGYHPTVVGETLHNRYEVIHKLDFGGYSTIWLARDKRLQQSGSSAYVSLKILTADESSKSTESSILRLLRDGEFHPGQQFVPRLLDDFSFDGPNGRHLCLVQNPVAACNIAAAKEDSVSLMFPVETARNFLLYTQDLIQNLKCLGSEELYKRYRLDKAPITRFDDQLLDPTAGISDYGTSFVVSTDADVLHKPELHTPALYLPPEGFFDEPITQAVDIWTLGVSLYEVLGERPFFESFGWDRDDIIAEMVSTLGPLPSRWWDAWTNRNDFFEPDGSWVRQVPDHRIYTPGSRPLRRRMWDMGRGETPDACQWDIQGGEMRALEELLRGMLAFEPAERLTAEQLMKSEYMEKWAMPAWRRQLARSGGKQR